MRRAFAIFLMYTILCWINVHSAAAQSKANPFDGRWSATVGPQGGCKFTSLLIIDVLGNSLVGYASNPVGVFPLTGKINFGGSGSFKIGAFVGAIRFSDHTFEAKYANNCGGRFATGIRKPPSEYFNNVARRAGDTAVAIPLLDQGDKYVAPILVNKTIMLRFVVDNGAPYVSIPEDIVATLIRAGTVDRADFLEGKISRLADGSAIPSTTFEVRSLTVDHTTVDNVLANVTPVGTDFVLGQSFLRRFSAWSIDSNNHKLILEKFPALAN
jgi:hypothetical protein